MLRDAIVDEVDDTELSRMIIHELRQKHEVHTTATTVTGNTKESMTISTAKQEIIFIDTSPTLTGEKPKALVPKTSSHRKKTRQYDDLTQEFSFK
jgi:fructose-1-phosphate kinase PfkB-like protein